MTAKLSKILDAALLAGDSATADIFAAMKTAVDAAGSMTLSTEERTALALAVLDHSIRLADAWAAIALVGMANGTIQEMGATAAGLN